ncbi:MAG: formylglycine-generating enzyme family protein [Planctomycetaceae bacterium]
MLKSDAGELPRELYLNPGVGGVVRMCLIPGGVFQMGSRGAARRYGNDWYTNEEPAHAVRLSSFYLGAYPVTQRQYSAWCEVTGRQAEYEFGGAGREDCPAENMSWEEAVAWCDWLTARCELQFPSGFRASLPTEAEWEYGCRLGVDAAGNLSVCESEYFCGDGESALAEAGWWSGNSGEKTHAVGQKLGTSLGLYDMHGNVREWCLDAWDGDAYRRSGELTEDPVVTVDEQGRAGRSTPTSLRSALWT